MSVRLSEVEALLLQGFDFAQPDNRKCYHTFYNTIKHLTTQNFMNFNIKNLLKLLNFRIFALQIDTKTQRNATQRNATQRNATPFLCFN
ncbi:hypothetical protein RCZ02_13020 [Capnocytophaga felis]|uniref:hypothetical protein n=1 Tax=Capnocytophaga felis TaxID=2267611 RepID=UPI0012D244F4|nr:hypothetical protein [Capnocytophaga felis]GET48471.1 hypothetical protein RCZ02_13020 [Capnocytophaga felis]